MSRGIKRRKMIPNTKNALTADYVIKYESDTIYTMIKEFPTEIQFQFFANIICCTYSISKILDLIDPEMASYDSQMPFIVRLLFERVVIVLDVKDITVYTLAETYVEVDELRRLLEYLETNPTEYLKLSIRNVSGIGNDIIYDCAQLASEIRCSNNRR
ncbi:unnamed protein product [Ambrosiozyma monospora]|uniref:Unnamed protein product n=1 Tax=Ambrosiozyma monospora TaxID=43982 RepID=A0ACB5T1J7_AMBMO|nr:unnamed protein product [Ambrosiozyma monospora]